MLAIAALRHLALIASLGLGSVGGMHWPGPGGRSPKDEAELHTSIASRLPRSDAPLLRQTASRARLADVCEVVYVNLDESVFRRLGMEANMLLLGVEARRFPAVSLDVVTLPSGQRNFTAESAAKLLDIFSEWGCGNWTATECHPDDQLCCKGLNLGTVTTWHEIAGNSDASLQAVEASSYLGNMASHAVILQQMRSISPTDPCIGTVIMEDDIRLYPQWLPAAREAVSMVPDFDIIKLYATGASPPSCQVGCASTGSGHFCLYDLARAKSCWCYSNGAWLVNPKSANKILQVLEQISHNSTSRQYQREGGLGSLPWSAPRMYSLDAILGMSAEARMLKIYSIEPTLGYTAAVGWNSTYD